MWFSLKNMYNKPMLNRAKFFLFGLVYAIVNLGVRAMADEPFYRIENPIKAGSFADVVKGFADLMVKIGIPLATVFLIWSGFLFVSARGNDEQLKKAKSTFYWTIVGTALLVGAYAIASAIVDFAKKL
ncbi:hypothetical protein A2661_00965 [Candidatus Giovannonibacteria bacterium RIFCSPHIGHO2_01_FULL_45_24]|nr:MAG: hypothetical protein A2661_00965 [Candidatus Giovannonibacteria bacterium RIFCSPHIGHO2_01_FULL_45_24]